MSLLGGQPRLMLVSAAALLLSLLALLWLLRRIGTAILARPHPPVSGAYYLFNLGVFVLFGAIGVASLGLSMALDGYQAIGRKNHVAELQCIELAPGKLRLYYVPIESDGGRGPGRTFDLDGDEWSIGGDVLRFRPFLNALGVNTIHRITRVEGRWRRADDANHHLPTAFDLNGGIKVWYALYQDVHRRPLSYLVAGAHGQAVSQLPDRRAIYNLYVTANGYVLEKATL